MEILIRYANISKYYSLQVLQIIPMTMFKKWENKHWINVYGIQQRMFSNLLSCSVCLNSLVLSTKWWRFSFDFWIIPFGPLVDLLLNLFCRFDEAKKKGVLNGYFLWLMIGYGTGGYLTFVSSFLFFILYIVPFVFSRSFCFYMLLPWVVTFSKKYAPTMLCHI